jgi:hypothetical protein
LGCMDEGKLRDFVWTPSLTPGRAFTLHPIEREGGFANGRRSHGPRRVYLFRPIGRLLP